MRSSAGRSPIRKKFDPSAPARDVVFLDQGEIEQGRQSRVDEHGESRRDVDGRVGRDIREIEAAVAEDEKHPGQGRRLLGDEDHDDAVTRDVIVQDGPEQGHENESHEERIEMLVRKLGAQQVRDRENRGLDEACAGAAHAQPDIARRLAACDDEIEIDGGLLDRGKRMSIPGEPALARIH